MKTDKTKKTRFALILAAASAAAGLALPAFGAQGFVGASGGRSDWPGGTCIPGGSCTRDDTAWSVRGGYMFTPYFGVEARFFDLGRSQTSLPGGTAPDGRPIIPFHAESEADGAGVGAVAAWPLGLGFTFSGAVGIARTDATVFSSVSVAAPGGGEATSQQFLSARKWKAYYAVALDYAFTRQLSLTLEAQRHRLPVEGAGSVDVVGAGLLYRF